MYRPKKQMCRSHVWPLWSREPIPSTTATKESLQSPPNIWVNTPVFPVHWLELETACHFFIPRHLLYHLAHPLWTQKSFLECKRGKNSVIWTVCWMFPTHQLLSAPWQMKPTHGCFPWRLNFLPYAWCVFTMPHFNWWHLHVIHKAVSKSLPTSHYPHVLMKSI